MPTAVNGDAAGPPTAGLDAVAAPPPTSTAGREDLEAEARVPPERDRAPRKAKYEEAGLRPTPALAAFGSALRRCNEKNAAAPAHAGQHAHDIDGNRLSPSPTASLAAFGERLTPRSWSSPRSAAGADVAFAAAVAPPPPRSSSRVRADANRPCGCVAPCGVS